MRSVREIYFPHLSSLQQRYLRVAAYCRVSTKHDEQLSSLAAQEAYYENYIRNHTNWELAGIYVDQGTGRNILKRNQFQQMLTDCRQGKIDLILTKSITRFGRNTLDVLNCFRELKHLGVDVHFEIEKHYLSNPRSELLMTVLTAISQEESRQKSQNIRWGIQRSFENEDTKYKHRKCFGYCHDQNGSLVVNAAQAEIVRLIYDLRLEGWSLRQIANELAIRGIRSPRGSQRWGPETLNKILNNEKYTGNVLIQKTVVEDFLNGKQRRNRGQENQYLIADSHPAIIERDMFDRVCIKK
ncbi:MAG: recombinase family protein [Bacillota bacterium]|nr:recombinase family protein [Bacillota bacterium]